MLKIQDSSQKYQRRGAICIVINNEHVVNANDSSSDDDNDELDDVDAHKKSLNTKDGYHSNYSNNSSNSRQLQYLNIKNIWHHFKTHGFKNIANASYRRKHASGDGVYCGEG